MRKVRPSCVMVYRCIESSARQQRTISRILDHANHRRKVQRRLVLFCLMWSSSHTTAGNNAIICSKNGTMSISDLNLTRRGVGGRWNVIVSTQ